MESPVDPDRWVTPRTPQDQATVPREVATGPHVLRAAMTELWDGIRATIAMARHRGPL